MRVIFVISILKLASRKTSPKLPTTNAFLFTRIIYVPKFVIASIQYSSFTDLPIK